MWHSVFVKSELPCKETGIVQIDQRYVNCLRVLLKASLASFSKFNALQLTFTSVHVIFTINSKRCCAFNKIAWNFLLKWQEYQYGVNELLALMRIWWIGLLPQELIVLGIHTCLSEDNEKDVNELSFFSYTLSLHYRCLDINLLTLNPLGIECLLSLFQPVRISLNFSRCFLIRVCDPLIF